MSEGAQVAKVKQQQRLGPPGPRQRDGPGDDDGRQADVVSEPPQTGVDGRWAWVVLTAAVFNTIFSASINTSFSILFGEKLKSMDMTATTISWVYNTHLFVWYLDTCVSGPLAQRYGWRAASLPAALVTAVVYGAFPYVKSQVLFFFLYSVVLGISGGICYQVTFLILPAYFQQHRGLALCLNSASNSIGQMLIPQLIRLLKHEFGNDGTILIYAAILLNMCVASALYRPIKVAAVVSCKELEEQVNFRGREYCIEMNAEKADGVTIKKSLPKKHEESKPDEIGITSYFKRCFTSLKKPPVVILGLSYGLFLVGHMNFTMLIPFVVREAGYGADDASHCLSVYAGSNLAARLANTALADRKFFNAKLVYMAGGISAAVLCVLFSLSLARWSLALVCLASYGFGSGASSSIFRVLLLRAVGLPDYPAALAAAGCLSAGLFITVAPLLGVARDGSSSFFLSMILAAGLKLLAALLLLLLPATRGQTAAAATATASQAGIDAGDTGTTEKSCDDGARSNEAFEDDNDLRRYNGAPAA